MLSTLTTISKFSLTCSLLVAVGMHASQPAAANDVLDDDLPTVDRQLLGEWIGYSPPPFPDSLQWYGRDGTGESGTGEQTNAQDRLSAAQLDTAPSWWDFIDRFVVLQSFTHVDEASTDRLKEVGDALAQYSFLDVQLIAFHTPQGADRVNAQVASSILNDLPEHTVLAVDLDGSYSDTLGIYTTPANLLVSREGTTINVGIAPEGFDGPLLRLLDLPAEANLTAYASPKRRGSLDADFPRITGSVRGGQDLRGKQAPEIRVQEWVTADPDCRGKVMLLEFWRTNCPHCINAIPKLNNLATQHKDDLCIVAVTHEDERQLSQGLSQRNVDINTIQYTLASDPSRWMQQRAEVTAVPHAMAISSDGIVRWQGHPAQFSEDILQQIVNAQNASPHARLIQSEIRRSDTLLAKDDRRKDGGFPSTRGSVRSGQDLRGKKAPALNVDQYVGPEPNCDNKITLYEFWRTSCPHCINAIPKLNAMAKQFEDDMCLIGITYEDETQLSQGLSSRNVELDTIEYTIGLDTERRTFQAAGVRSVPHAMVVCSQGIVRWQGHPASLDDDVVQQIIDADQSASMPKSKSLPRNRWQKKLSAARN